MALVRELCNINTDCMEKQRLTTHTKTKVIGLRLTQRQCQTIIPAFIPGLVNRDQPLFYLGSAQCLQEACKCFQPPKLNFPESYSVSGKLST